MKSFQELLDPRILTSQYSQRERVSRTFTLTDYFLSNPEQIEKNEAEFVYYPAMNEPAPINAPGAPARVLTPGGGTKRHVSLFRAFNEIALPGDALSALREPDSQALQAKGRQVVSLTFDQFSERHRLMKEVILGQFLAVGRVNFNNVGQILVPSVNSSTGAITDASGTVVSADFGVANGHRGNIGSIISALWSTASTSISSHLDAIDDAAEAAGVPKPTHIWIHSFNKKYLRTNTEFQTWAKESNTAPDAVLRGDMIENLWGKTWHFLGSKYQGPSDSGNDTNIIPKTVAVMHPDPGPWMRTYKGSELVPRSIDIKASVDEALANLEALYGQFAYAKLSDNPAHLLMRMGDNFGFAYADPNAVWCPTVFSGS